MNPKALGAALAVVLMVGGAACSNGDDDAAPAGGSAPVTEASGDPTGGEGDATETTATAAGGEGGAGDADDAATDGSGEALATVRAQLPADVSDRRLVPLRLDVMRLDRTGDLIELDILLTNEAPPTGQDPPGFTPWDTFADSVARADLSGLGLLVSGEQKLYLPVFDSAGACLCTDALSAVEIAAGQSLPLDATFGAVPDDADSLDIRIPSFPIIEGVEVGG